MYYGEIDNTFISLAWKLGFFLYLTVIIFDLSVLKKDAKLVA
jgi:hypothetical protein